MTVAVGKGAILAGRKVRAWRLRYGRLRPTPGGWDAD